MKKTLSIILALMLIALCAVSCDSNTSTTSLKSIEITNKPTKTEYKINESIDTTGIVVTATYTNGKTKAVTDYTVDTTILTSVGTTKVTVTYSLNGKVRTATFDVNVTYPQFTVNFMKNDSIADNPSSATKKVDYEKPYGELPTVEKTNYTFLGWYDAPKGGNKIEATTKVTKTTDHSLYARWIENGKYIVTFACTDNDNPTTEKVPDDITGYVNQSILVPGNVGKKPLTKTGYTFDGWTDGTTDYDSGSFIKSDTETSITLRVKWKPNEYTITYKDIGDVVCTATTNTSPTKHTYGTETILVNPIKDSGTTGAEFLGWYKDSACSDDKKVTSLAATDYTDNITLYAKWRGWVQLWAGGPKWAEFNVGSTISNYTQANNDVSAVTNWLHPTADDNTLIAGLYTKANVGGFYTWGGSTDVRVSYVNDSNTGSSDLTGTADTATKLWGSNWKMPSTADLNNLRNYNDAGNTQLTGENILTDWTWCDGGKTPGQDRYVNGKQYVEGCTLVGYKVTGKGNYADNSIFLPAAGYRGHEQGVGGHYWSSTYYYYYPLNVFAYDHYFGINGQFFDDSYRSFGLSVRAVLK